MKNPEKAIGELSRRLDELEKVVFRNATGFQPISAGISIDAENLGYLRGLGSAIAMSLAILDHVFQKDTNHPGLTPDELASILKRQFGLPVPLSTISSQLYVKTGRYVTRDQVSHKPVKYRYRILPRGQDYIRSRIRDVKGEAPLEPLNSFASGFASEQVQHQLLTDSQSL